VTGVYSDSLTLDSAGCEDRTQFPRGDTPLLDIDPEQPLRGYPYQEYISLRERGATRLMIETFNLEFDFDSGIFAYADGPIFEEFSGPQMKTGDVWKIQLGRRFTLDPDDPDGSLFIEGILEEAVLFGSATHEWETIEEQAGLWVTQRCEWDDEEEYEEDNGDYDEAGDEQDEDDDSDGYLDQLDDPTANSEWYERMLDNPPADGGPVLRFHLYQNDTAETEDDVQMSIVDLLDSAYRSDDDSTTQDSNLEVETETDSAGSDFDSDEMLSGDEDLVEHAKILMDYRNP
jgi:hypothetical protein